MRLQTYGFTATPPPGVRLLFDQQGHPEGSWDWFAVLAETTLSGREGACIIALVDEAGRAVSAVPVVTIDGYVIRGLASPFTTLFSAPFGGRENARTLGRLLAGKVGGTLRLDALDSEDGASRAFEEGLALGGLVTARFQHFANWFEQIDDFTAYWNGRGSKLKATVKRKAAPLLRAGRLAFAQIDMTEGWQQAAQIYKGIYAKSWKPAEPHPDFIDRLLEKMGRRGIAKLGVVTIDGLPAAAQIWLVQGRHATIFKLAHDPAFDRQSPGTLLTHWILQQLHEIDGVRDVDFGRGDDAYKREWLSLNRHREGFVAANPRTFKGLAVLIFDFLPSKITRIFRQKTGKGNAASATAMARVAIGGYQA